MLLDPVPPFVKLGAEAIVAEIVAHEAALLYYVGVLGKPFCTETFRAAARFDVSHLVFIEVARLRAPLRLFR